MKSNSILFSIVIPTYNRPERLQKCLESIAQLDYPRDRFEVVIVDDGSQTPLQPVIDRFRSDLPLNYIQQSNAGPANARNTGAASATGQYLVFTDDDCQPTSTWLSSLEAAFQACSEALIGGRTINALPGNIFSSASQLLIDYLYEYYNQAHGEPTFFASNNFAMPRGFYQQLGGFDTSFPLAAGEDREFCDRWKHHQFPMRYAPNMKILHAHKLSLKSFWRQHFNYGRGAFCFHTVRANRTDESIKVEPISFYFNLLMYPLKETQSLSSALISGLLFLSQVANVAGFFWERNTQHRHGKLVVHNS
ncbi:MAG: glycosyltransferase [Cyanobacteria bacterium P01_C01_bin.73]